MTLINGNRVWLVLLAVADHVQRGSAWRAVWWHASPLIEAGTANLDPGEVAVLRQDLES